MVEFVSFTPLDYNHACVGSLVLKIDGEKVRFGDDIDDNYDRFWASGGDAYTDDKGNIFVHKGPWHTKNEYLPEKYVKYKDEIMKTFNKNVRWGCCGACADEYVKKGKKEK